MAVSSSELLGPAVELSHRPQALVLPFLGALVLDRQGVRVRSTVFLRLLGDLGVAEPAARATLHRMRERGLLDRHRSGREVTWTITEFGSALLTRNRERVEADDPFARTDDTWTLLSYSMPETRRDLRHQVRATLGWAGFGGLRDGLWIAPGTIDVEQVLRDAGLDELGDLADWFSARPLPGTDVADVICRAWDLDAVAAVHEAFLDRWQAPPTDLGILPRFTLLGADWLQVLRVDPGLPVAHLPDGWPAPESARLHARLLREWREQAVAELDRQLADG
jgi:DNA-binding transcriptional regulator PaaX